MKLKNSLWDISYTSPKNGLVWIQKVKASNIIDALEVFSSQVGTHFDIDQVVALEMDIKIKLAEAK